MPLHRVGWGLVLVFLDVRVAGFDLLPDILGWALVASGLGRLMPPVEARGHVVLAYRAAWVAAAVAAPTWFLAATGSASALLPAVELVLGGVVTVLVAGAAAALAEVAGAEPDRRVWTRLRVWLAGSLAVAAPLAAVALVTGSESVAAASIVVAIAHFLAAAFATWTAFQHAHRPWAAPGRGPGPSPGHGDTPPPG